MATSTSALAEPASRSGFSRFFRNPATGKVVVVQTPNLPLAVFLIGTVARMAFHSSSGAVGVALSVATGVGLVVWAVLEIARGDSPFRRVLGGIVLIGSVLSLVMR